MSAKNGYLSEAQAWRAIARRIAAGKWQHRGLCYEIGELAEEGKIDAAVDLRMSERIDYHLPPLKGWSRYAYPPGTEQEARVLAALWLALEAEDEATS